MIFLQTGVLYSQSAQEYTVPALEIHHIFSGFHLTYHAFLIYFTYGAEVAEQADAHDSKSCTFGYVGSIPTFGINKKTHR